MMKLGAFALILALGACKSSSEVAKSSSSANSETSGEVAQGPSGRSGKIDLPQVKPSTGSPEAPKLPDGRGDRTKFDADGDGQLSEAEREARRNAFRDERMKELDTDGDGKISDAERAAGRAARDAERTARLDTDGDGQVSDTERAAAQAERAANMHARMDTNSDGKLTTEELANARWFRGDATKADANGDGVIAADELQAAMSERRGGRGGPRRFGGEGSGYRPGQ
jgi:hypothetical protein